MNWKKINKYLFPTDAKLEYIFFVNFFICNCMNLKYSSSVLFLPNPTALELNVDTQSNSGDRGLCTESQIGTKQVLNDNFFSCVRYK